MINTFTIGFTKKSAEEFFTKLRDIGVASQRPTLFEKRGYLLSRVGWYVLR